MSCGHSIQAVENHAMNGPTLQAAPTNATPEQDSLTSTVKMNMAAQILFMMIVKPVHAMCMLLVLKLKTHLPPTFLTNAAKSGLLMVGG